MLLPLWMSWLQWITFQSPFNAETCSCGHTISTLTFYTGSCSQRGTSITFSWLKTMGNVVESDYFHCLYMILLLHHTAEGILHFLLHYIWWTALLSTNFADYFSYMISSKHIMHSFSKKKKKVSLYCGHLSLESSEDYVLLFLLKSANEEEIFQLSFLHKSKWE